HSLAPVPSVIVVVAPSIEFSDAIFFEWKGQVRSQSMLVTSRPNHYLRCHSLGHVVKDRSKRVEGKVTKRPRPTSAKDPNMIEMVEARCNKERLGWGRG